MKSCISNGLFFHNNTINYRKDKTPYYVEWNISPIKNEIGEITHFVSVQRDISEKYESLKFQAMLIAAINATPDTIVITDDQSRIKFINSAVEKLTGYTFEELTDKPIHKLYQHNEQLVELSNKKKGLSNFEHMKDLDQNLFLDLIFTPLKDHKGVITHHLSVGRNINHHIKVKSQLEEWANYDSLTSVFNRRYGDHLLATIQNDMLKHNNCCCILLSDIDNFKTINDTYGHSLGDKVLQKVMSEIAKNIRSQDSLIRWGGDEILVVLPGIKLSSAVKIAERLRTAIESYNIPTAEKVTMSSGVVAWKRGETKESVLKRVDEQLYISKNNGRNCVFSQP